MLRVALLSLASMFLALPASAQEGPGPWSLPPPGPPYLAGTWFNGGNRDQPCQIRQRPGSDRALFVNEQGSEAPGVIRPDRVIIPTWGEDEQGLVGVLRGDRIVWPDGNYWSRGRPRGVGPLGPVPAGVPDVAGTWFNKGDPDQPCEIRQRPGSDRVLFVNEQGSEAPGFIRGDRLVVPSWGNAVARFRGDRIIWPNGGYWTR